MTRSLRIGSDELGWVEFGDVARLGVRTKTMPGGDGSLAYLTHGARLAALGGTLVLTGEGTTEAPTLSAAATVSHVPRWEQLPSGV